MLAPGSLHAQTATTSTTTVELTSTKTVQVKVKGVGCSNDLRTISANVEKLAGVTKCETLKHGAVTTFEVTLDPSVTSAQKVHAAIEDTPGCGDPADRPYKVKS